MQPIIAPTEMLRVPLVTTARVALCPLGMKVNPKRVQQNVAEMVEDVQAGLGAAPYFIPDAGSPFQRNAAVVRKVQIIVPNSPSVFWDLDHLPEEVGPGRTYKLPPIPSGQMILVDLAPWQWLIAATETKHGACSLVVSYITASSELMARAERHKVP